jgi:RNA polymerase sigma-70 factor (ECF subfamily)
MSDEELTLARACAAGDTTAIAEVERRADLTLRRALGRLRLDASAADDVRQAVRTKLFVGDGDKPPAIASYEGKGPLVGFLRAVVVHAALSAKRRDRRHDGDSVIEGLAASDDPGLLVVRETYGASFAQAFRDALAELSARERNVLRLVYVEGLTVEQVAVTYGVHRVSVSRWLGTARGTLQGTTNALLRTRLSLGASEAASVARLCLADLDVSLNRLLQQG